MVTVRAALAAVAALGRVTADGETALCSAAVGPAAKVAADAGTYATGATVAGVLLITGFAGGCSLGAFFFANNGVTGGVADLGGMWA